MKTAQQYLEEAHSVVPRISAEEGIAKWNAGRSVFLDVRDSGDITKSGTIKGALRVSRGFIEFAADPATKFHKPELTKDADIVLLCGAGGQAALCGKTLLDMGYKHVSNVGGFKDWADAGGPVEDG